MARKGKAPAFQFYASDWLADLEVRAMSLAERGAYIDLLAFAWREGSIPTAVEKCARLVGETLETFEPTWSAIRARFVEIGDGKMVSPRQEIQRAALARFVKSQGDKGKRSAAVRKMKSTAVDVRLTSGCRSVQPKTNSSSATASSTAKDPEETLPRARMRDPGTTATEKPLDGGALEALWVAATGKPAGNKCIEAAALCRKWAPMRGVSVDDFVVDCARACGELAESWRARGYASYGTTDLLVEHFPKVFGWLDGDTQSPPTRRRGAYDGPDRAMDDESAAQLRRELG